MIACPTCGTETMRHARDCPDAMSAPPTSVKGLLLHIGELELRVQTLETVIQANYEMAELSLCIARAGIVVRPDTCPEANPLNDEPEANLIPRSGSRNRRHPADTDAVVKL